MYYRSLISLGLLFSVCFFSYSQEDTTKIKPLKNLPAFGGGIGFLSFQGDVGELSSVSAFSNFRSSYFFTLEQRFGSFIGIQANATYGNVSKNERGTERNLNFESTIMGGELMLNFYFDNNKLMPKHNKFSPFIGVGAGYYVFDAYGDLSDADGNAYHYWSDGSIRDLEESDENLNANYLNRDYVYETQLTDSVEYDRSTLAFPIHAGFRFNINHNLSANLTATYYITQTDYIDNFKSGEDNDAFLSGKMTILYHLGRKAKDNNNSYDDVDFSLLDKLDGDEDGVKDESDECPMTKKDVKVDGKGCAIDSDKDGVPDYLDKEEKTEKDAVVDSEGRTITEADLIKLYSDSLATDRDKIREEYPSLYGILVSDPGYPDESMLGDGFDNNSTGEENTTFVSNPDSKIPARFQEADFDGDQTISPNEIYNVIDGFFEGSNGFDIKTIHELIDYFFDQE